MAVTRDASLCLSSGGYGCSQRFHYQWDEVGRLVHAQRWDVGNPDVNDDSPLTAPPSADLTYAYDASDNRVLKRSTTILENWDEVHLHSVYISGGQELRGAQFGAAYLDAGATGADYQIDSKTEVAYLFAHGVRLGRVAYDNGTGMPAYTANASLPAQHVLINLDDTLGSTAIVIDKATSELVEASSYLAYGAAESDYRPDRWNGLREDYRFTGKEEDVEVGLQYFGKRFLSPYLGRWVSADPLAVHVPGKADWNLYAYVSGAVLKSVDPVGLCGDQDACIRGDFRTSDVPEVRAIGDSNHPPAGDQDKAADSLGVPREQIKNGLPTAEAIDHARQGLPSSLQQDTTLKPTGNGQGIQGWTTESGGTKRQYTPTGKEDGYAGEKPAVPTMSPLDLVGPAAAKGLWALGGRALRLGNAAGEIGAGGGPVLRAPFNPSGSMTNCVNGVCAFLNSVRSGSLQAASSDVAENSGSIRTVLSQIETQTGAQVGRAGQWNTLQTGFKRQFFVVFRGSSASTSNHVAVGIANNGERLIYDPQTGQRFWNLTDYGSFTAFPVKP